jgi:dolichol-phosphate mannosyltransferase
MSDALVVIPTFNERENVRSIAEAVLKAAPVVDILFVDDNSPDGTGRIIDEMARTEPRINVVHNNAKNGLGRAYVAGFKWALQRDYRRIMEMDADFSHDPKEIPNFLKAAESADLVLGSRYKNGIRIINWPLRRLMISTGAAKYVRLITGMPVTDPTGGFKCFRREVLEATGLDTIESNGYAFQIEMTHAAWLKGFNIVEIPITFEDRRSGHSKMEPAIFSEALWLVWKLAFRGLFRRRAESRPVAGKTE